MKLGGGEAGVHFPGLRGLGGGPHPLNAFFHGDGPAICLVHTLESPQPQLLRRLFQLLNLSLLLLVLLHALLKAALLFHGVKTIVAAVKFRLAVQHLNDACHCAVQKVAVVGNCHHRAPEGADIVLQPLGGMEVQVVGRLVQQQDVRVLQDQAA